MWLVQFILVGSYSVSMFVWVSMRLHWTLGHGCGMLSDSSKNEADLLLLMWKKGQEHCSVKATLKSVEWSDPIGGNTYVFMFHSCNSQFWKNTQETINCLGSRDRGWGDQFEEFHSIIFIPFFTIRCIIFYFLKITPIYRWWSSAGELKWPVHGRSQNQPGSACWGRRLRQGSLRLSPNSTAYLLCDSVKVY